MACGRDGVRRLAPQATERASSSRRGRRVPEGRCGLIPSHRPRRCAFLRKCAARRPRATCATPLSGRFNVIWPTRGFLPASPLPACTLRTTRRASDTSPLARIASRARQRETPAKPNGPCTTPRRGIERGHFSFWAGSMAGGIAPPEKRSDPLFFRSGRVKPPGRARSSSADREAGRVRARAGARFARARFRRGSSPVAGSGRSLDRAMRPPGGLCPGAG